MKHLIPKAADYLRQLRWPKSVVCPRCGSSNVEQRERYANGLQCQALGFRMVRP